MDKINYENVKVKKKVFHSEIFSDCRNKYCEKHKVKGNFGQFFL